MNFVRQYAPAFLVGAAVSALAVVAVAVLERPPQTAASSLSPTLGPAVHPPIDLWYGDDVAFNCTACPTGSQYRIDKVELLRQKILDELSGVAGTQNAQALVRDLPPRDGLAVPSSPFGAWVFPTAFVDRTVAINTDPVPNTFKAYTTSQIYAVTWTVKYADDSTQTFDPHIYVHGGKRY